MTYLTKRKYSLGEEGQSLISEKRRAGIWLSLGMGLMLLSGIPNVILGENSIFTYFDQLDGEMIAYILQAKNLFSGDVLPEFMGGMSKTALTLPAPLCIVLFLCGNYYTALLAMQLVGRVVGFAGMFLLVRETAKAPWIAAAAGVLYGFLPFLPVYGLSQYGIPLLFWSVLQIKKGKRILFSYVYVAFFSLTSSLVLVGFALLGMLGVSLVWEVWRERGRKKGKAGILRCMAAWLLMLGIYLAENAQLLAQMLGIDGKGEISHKQDYELHAVPFWSTLKQNLLEGGQHSEAYHSWLVGAVLVMGAVSALACLISKWGKKAETVQDRGLCRSLKHVGICLGWLVFFSSAAAFWNCAAGISVRRGMGALGAFQVSRLLWIAPCLWYLAAACGTSCLWNLWGKKKDMFHKIMQGVMLSVITIAAGLTGMKILYAGDIKSNIQKLRNDDYAMLSYSDYYAIGVMEQVRDFLEEQTGKKQDEYRVVSLGIDPAAALYHGFYCLDGYSNNYSLDYKHRFRRVIAPELEKSEYLREYFDGWGNRCYLFSAECPAYYTIEKNGFYFQEYQLDAEALREMGCSYILSAAYIINAEEQGLRLMNDIPFETENSYYRIFIYAL